MLLRHLIAMAFSFARLKAGSRRLARMAMMAMTTSSSITVNEYEFALVVFIMWL